MNFKPKIFHSNSLKTNEWGLFLRPLTLLLDAECLCPRSLYFRNAKLLIGLMSGKPVRYIDIGIERAKN
jgi:hypothetical protein